MTSLDKASTSHDNMARLALVATLEKACKELSSPRGGKNGAPNLRTEVDDGLRGLYEEHGVSQSEIRVNGEKVGTISARLSKPESGVRPEITSLDEFVAWLIEDNDYLLMLVDKYKSEVLGWIAADGVVPDGCRMVAYEKPAQWLGTTIRVDPKKTVAAYKGALPEAVAGLLEGE